MDAVTPAMTADNVFLGPIVDRARRDPDQMFGMFHEPDGWRRVSVGAALTRALQFAALLQSRNLPAGSTIMLALHQDADAPCCFLGAMLAGMVPSFLPCPSSKQDHTLYWNQHKTVLAFNRPPIVAVPEDLVADMTVCAEGSGAEVVVVTEIDRHAPAPYPASLPASDEVGLLQHSSGTTGMKKGVALSYGSIARQLAAYRDSLGLDPATARIVSWLPLYHDMGLISSFLMPVWLGVPILAIDPFVWVGQPELYLDAIEQFQGTHGWLPNFAFLHLARRVNRKRQWDLSSVQALISCSEPCKAAAFDAFLERFGAHGIDAGKLQTCYAMAETVFAVSQSPVGTPVRRLVVDADCVRELGTVRPPAEGATPMPLLSNGSPIAGCQVAILRDGALVGQGELGEICVHANYMFSGYHLNEAATQAAFHGDWYRTGDIGFVEQGDVFVVGRIKDVIIINGKNVFVHDIEAAVSRVGGVKPGRAVAFGRYSDKAGSELLVVVAERDGPAEADRDVQRDINRAVVEEVGVPCSDIRVVEQGWLVKTTSGKTSRSENAVKYARDFLGG
jgi:acyl-CoA synthetase (AMP-forming)/AMP-acid ligase II